MENEKFYGRVGNEWFVNSASSLSRDNVEETFQTAEPNGSVPLDDLFELIQSRDKSVSTNDLIIGGVAIRMYIESLGERIRDESYTKRQANYIKNAAGPIIKKIECKGGALEYASESELTRFVRRHHHDGKEEHRKSLIKAREKIRNSSE